MSRTRHRRDAERPRLHERGREGAVHRQVRRLPVHGEHGAALRPDRGERDVLRPGSHVPLPLRERLGRPPRRRDRVLVRGLPAQLRSGDQPRGRQRVRRPRYRHAVRLAVAPVQRRRQRAEPGQRELVHHDERDPARGHLSAVRELAVDEVRPPGRAVRPAHRRELRVLADRRRLVQAAHADDRRPRGRRRRSRSGRPTTPRPSGITSSSRPITPAWTTGRRFPTRTGNDHEHGAELSGGLERRCTRGSTTTRRSRAPRRATRPGRPVRGTPRPATRAAGRSGRSTSPTTPAGRSRSRSATRATGRPRGSASSSTT